MANDQQNKKKSKLKIELTLSKPVEKEGQFILECYAYIHENWVIVPDGEKVIIHDNSLKEVPLVTDEGRVTHTFKYGKEKAGEKIEITARIIKDESLIKANKSIILPKEKEDKKKVESKDFSKVLEVVASIIQKDISGNTTRKIEQWMTEIGHEREIIFSSLQRLPLERIRPIIQQIVHKADENTRRNITEILGLYSLEINQERYAQVLIDAEKEKKESLGIIEEWLKTLTVLQVNYFRSSISKMKVAEAVKKYLYLSELTSNDERTEKTKNLKLLLA
jgi:hypothetical protein